MALQASKGRGTRLGRHGADHLAPALRAQTVGRAKGLGPAVAEIRATGAYSPRAIAAALNARGIATAQGKTWSAMQVK